MIIRGTIIAAVLLATSTTGFAAPEDYCEAYARDFADSLAPKGDEWQRRFGNARDACLLQYTPQQTEAPKVDITNPEPPKADPEPTPEPAAAPEPDPEPTVKSKSRKREKPVQQAEPKVKKSTPKVVVAKTKPKPATKTRRTKPSVTVAPDTEVSGINGPSILEEALAEGRPTTSAETTTAQKPTLVKSLLKRFNPRILTRRKDDKKTETAEASPVGSKLRPGSAAWNDYCSRKYASFNADTGNYTSYNGVERKCLVTRN